MKTAALALSLATSFGAAAATAPPLSEASGTYRCTYKLFSRCGEGTASVLLQGGRLQQVSLEARFCATGGQPARRCSLSSARSGKDKWSDTGASVRIEFLHPKYPEMEDALLVSIEGGAIVLDLGESQPLPHCGMGADLPDRLTLEPAAAHCKVEF